MGDLRRVALVGTGLIGGSIGLGLTKAGIEVVGFDRDGERATQAVAIGAVARVVDTPADAVAGSDLTVVAVPVGDIADAVVAALDAGATLVTDVGSVKAPVVASVEAARPGLATRFIGGHPMAGSEQDGLAGADAGMFVGATWVLTPTGRTDGEAFTVVRAMAASLGAEAIALTPELHDTLVAVISHVPQLAASTLMNVANERSAEHAIVLRLAAGGFRDMTRIASSRPTIWPDICLANRDAILTALDAYLDELMRVRAMVASSERDSILDVLDRARQARRNLPAGVRVEGTLSELRVPVPDREGVIAEVATLAAAHGVNIRDFEIAHSLEGAGGVIVMVVADHGLDAFEASLHDHGYHTARTPLT